MAAPGEPGVGGRAADAARPLRAVDAHPGPDVEAAAGEVGDESASALGGRHGLALAYAVLERLVDEHGLARAAAVVDDPELGRQLLLDRRHPLSDADLALFDLVSARSGAPDAARGLHTRPAVDAGALDGELVTALIETSLRVATLGEDGDRGAELPARPDAGADRLELAVRRMPGVGAVLVDAESGVVQVLAAADSAIDLARRVVDLATSFLDGAVAVEILRDTGGADGSAREASGYGLLTHTELVAVTNAFETQELEVHLRRAGVRTIGRAPSAHGLAGAVQATLDALAELGDEPARELEWVRTIETSAQRRFLVALAMQDPAGTTHYGLADDQTPIAAAARAVLNSLGS